MSDDLIREARGLVELFGAPQSGIITRLADALEAARRERNGFQDAAMRHAIEEGRLSAELQAAEAQAERLATLFQSYADSYVGDKGWDEAYEALAAYREWRDGQG